MRLDEIEQAVAAAQKRLDAVKAKADNEKKRAKELKARADQTADLLKQRDAGRNGLSLRKAIVLPPSAIAALHR